MNINLIFKIAAVGILVSILSQVLKHSGRDEQAFLTSLAGQLFEGKVVSIKEFGAFVEFAPGKEGMVHISKLSKNRVEKVEDVVSLGDVVKVVCLGKDKMGRFSFSMKDVAE